MSPRIRGFQGIKDSDQDLQVSFPSPRTIPESPRPLIQPIPPIIRQRLSPRLHGLQALTLSPGNIGVRNRIWEKTNLIQ